ncbi:MAG: mycothiol system anti-sigma-R factor [Acidimicrobiales bacterium]
MGEDGNCDEALHELYEFLDGEITPRRRAEIKRHLEDCPPCYEQFDFEADLRQVLAHKCRDAVPDTLRQRIAKALGMEVPPAPGAPI